MASTSDFGSQVASWDFSSSTSTGFLSLRVFREEADRDEIETGVGGASCATSSVLLVPLL